MGQKPGPEPRKNGKAAQKIAAAGAAMNTERATRIKYGFGRITTVVVAIVVGFMVAANLSKSPEQNLSGLRQDDLVRVLNDVVRKTGQLQQEQRILKERVAELRKSSTTQEQAQIAAREQARIRGVLAGTVPAVGPGLEFTLYDPQKKLKARHFVTLLEELRNAGAEAIEVSGVRISTRSWFTQASAGQTIIADGTVLSTPYEWKAICSPITTETALEIPGGAFATIRLAGGEITLKQSDSVQIDSVRKSEALDELKVIQNP